MLGPLSSLKRVCLIGAESTGKTTLAEGLARLFETVWVPEYAREYIEATGRACGYDDLIAIAKGQCELEDRLALLANSVLFCDTDLLTTMIWSECHYGRCPEEIVQMAEQRTYDLFLLTDIDIPWVDDGLRDSHELREQIHNRIAQELRARGLNYVTVSGTLDERITTAVESVNCLL